MVEKSYILAEIRRTARENGGVPLGRQAFLKETGIRQTDWYGKHWARWGDAINEAGLKPNKLNEAIPDDVLLRYVAELTRELGHFPTAGEMRLKCRQVAGCPHNATFEKFGSRAELAGLVAEFCTATGGWDDVLPVCLARAEQQSVHAPVPSQAFEKDTFGSVYLLRSGKFYKIGKTNCLGRREREVALQLPERTVRVHEIRTDDPSGIESYWHRRFQTKHKNGEWYELDHEDVEAFKRRRFM